MSAQKRVPFIGANWKMYLMPDQVIPYIETIKNQIPKPSETQVMIAASPLYLWPLLKHAVGSDVIIGAENCDYHDTGAYTGEVSPKALAEIGIQYSIAGHSERRHYFDEDPTIVNKKVHALLRNQINPIVCCDETLVRTETNDGVHWVVSQVIAAFKNVSSTDALKMMIAYEPRWAIGTGITASADEAEEGCALIRQTISRIYSPEVAETVRVLYGGSVTPKNVKALMAKPDIDGVLVGSASLDPDEFLNLIHY
ncbi:triose-phosphate isomerase [Nicoliella spurrieriana]|uniref:Triosephosphate isomerase n=1 Tax=Nicoliella spurrieriana TaxID=2925830 RepID=A0A976RSA3_9LACO|nr:triose-phosphate isomerase [Nicoliella spurrieriana]UQS86967.1 triose-phosphate isomerase [Nicoliella spurrieriana]